MNINNTATLRLHLWELDDIGETPQSCMKEIMPKEYVDYKWIPQTLGDQVWLWIEFSSVVEKKNFLNTLPRKYSGIKGFIATNFTQKDLDYWT